MKAISTKLATVLEIPTPTNWSLLKVMYVAAMTPPTNDETRPAQKTRVVPHAAAAYSTPRIATLMGSGPSPAAICTSAPAHATARAMPGASRPIATAPHCSTAATTSPPMPTASGTVVLRFPGA